MYYVLVLFRKAFEVLLPEGVSFRPEPGSFGHVVVRAHALSRARYDDNDGVDVGAVGSWRSGRWRGSNSHLPARPPGWRKKTSQTAKQALIEEATPGRVPYSPYSILLHVLLIVLPFVRLLYYV